MKEKQYEISFINKLRGFSVILVIFYHYFPAYFKAGYVGVDIFFIISGFVITESIKRHELLNYFDVLNFYSRRLTRLLPSMLFILVLSTSCAYLFYFEAELKSYGEDLIASLLFTQNENLATNTNYFNQDVYNRPLTHFWSLSIEMQFYIFFPLIFLFLARKSNTALFLCMFCIVLFSFFFAVFE